VSFHRRRRLPHDSGGFLDAQAPEVAQFDNACLGRVDRFQLFQGVIQAEQLDIVGFADLFKVSQRHALAAVAFRRRATTGVIDQDLAHQPCADREQVAAVVGFDGIESGKPQPGLVDQGRGLQGVIASLATEELFRQTMQFRVQRADQSVAGTGVALAPVGKKLGHGRFHVPECSEIPRRTARMPTRAEHARIFRVSLASIRARIRRRGSRRRPGRYTGSGERVGDWGAAMDLSVEMTAMRLLEQALALPLSQRAAWLATLQAEDRVLARLRELLAAATEADTFLETPLAPSLAAAAPGDRGHGLPKAGDRLGAWRIVRELDRGGMGVVYLGRRDDGTYEQLAAIKLIRTGELIGHAQHAQLVSRFQNERRLLARLDHRNIARILDGGETAAGEPFLAMEFVDGPSLLVHCDEARLDVPARIAVFRKVCAGVQAAHRHLIVHRDLKPQNILVGADGEPRLLDFGIARILEPDAPDGSATQTQFVAMTPAYASPEQLRQEALTTASDIYSLGVILFELLTGVRPYRMDNKSPAQAERLISTGARSQLRRALLDAPLPDGERRARLARISTDLERIVAKAMHPDPVRRYESAQALADDLQRQLRGQPVLAHPDSLRYRIGKFVRRHRIGTAAAALALLAILAATAAAFWQARQANRAAADMALVNRFLTDVIQVSNPFAAGEEMTLGDALDEAAGKIDERFADRPDIAVDIRNTLAESLQARFRTEAAGQQYERAAQDGERLFGRHDHRVLMALNGLAAVRKDQSRMSEAVAIYEDILGRIEESGHTQLPTYAGALNDLGVAHLIMENHAKAAGYLQRSLDAMEHVNRPEDEALFEENRALTTISLAQAHRSMGNLDRAAELYDQGQRELERLYPDGAPQLGVVLNSQARLAQDRGNLPAAIDFQKRSIAMLEKTLRGDHAHKLVPMVNLARLALTQGDLALAEEWAGKAMAMADRLYASGAPHPLHVNALSALAAVRMAQERREEAATMLGFARDMLPRIDSVPRSTSDRIAGQIGELCADRSRPPLSVCRQRDE
jgi:tetratricopeptide (TPR) repeat protein